MDGSYNYPRTQRGSVSRRLGTSSYLLELVPDVQPAGDGVRHRMQPEGFPSQFQLTQRTEEARHDVFGAMQSLHWGREDRPPPPPMTTMTKCRLSRSKRRPLPTDTTIVTTDSSLSTSTKDRVIFAESPVAPGVPVVYRTPEERALNPDRLNLDRRHLTVCPILEGEDRLRLLNVQHNSITKLQHLSNLRRLVFLDLYDNLIHEIAGLEGLLSLRVLMLGKNRIRRIAGLLTLLKLDVLDLHGNMISEIEHLSHLSHLRVLNLAGNEITCASQLAGLQALTELNLRRNRITHVYEVDELPNLQRLFLSHNFVQSFDDVACLSQCEVLLELTLDGNPLANSLDHRLSVIYHVRHLTSLDQKPVTDEERCESLAVARQEEEREKELHKLAQMQERKESTIAAIRRAWETTHTQMGVQVLGGSANTQSMALVRRNAQHMLKSSSLPQLITGYFVDHSGSTLNLYGPGALEALESPPHGPHPINEIHFHYVEFEEIVPWLPKIAHTCSEVTSLSFDCTNLIGLDQLNALADIGISMRTLTISPWGNPITSHPLFLLYVLYRLRYLGLTELNGEPISEKDVVVAEQVFGKLGELTTMQLPQSRLLVLISKYRPRSVGSKRSTLLTSDSFKRNSVCMEPLNRIGLHYHSPYSMEHTDTGQQVRQTAAKSFCSRLLSSTLATHKKLQLFEGVWPKVLSSLVHQILQEYSDLDTSMQALLDHL